MKHAIPPAVSIDDEAHEASDRVARHTPPRIGVHSVPSKKLLEVNGPVETVQCTLTHRFLRGNNGLPTDRLEFSLDTIQTPALFAKRGPWLSKVKFCILDDSGNGIGSVQVVQSNMASHVYAIHQGDDIVAFVAYQVPSLVGFVAEAPPRRAQVAVAATNYLAYQPGQSAEFTQFCLTSLRQSAMLPDALDAAVNHGVHMHAMASKDPYLKPNGRRGLDFGGRGRLSSNKNMQIWMNDVKTWQMAKLDDGPKTYHVDYAAPLTMFQAFGLALAQMDL